MLEGADSHLEPHAPEHGEEHHVAHHQPAAYCRRDEQTAGHGRRDEQPARKRPVTGPRPHAETEAAAGPAVVLEWGRRTEVEYRSAAITQTFVLWLIQVGASPDLVRAGLRIVEDEIDHAALSHEVYVAAGGTSPPVLDRAELRLEAISADLETDVLLACVRTFCLGETVAVPLFRNLRRGCTCAVARTALDRILRDEGRHSAFGWKALDWFLDAWGDDLVTETIAPELDHMVNDLRTVYRACEDDSFDEADRPWGLAPSSEYASIVERTITHELLPRFAKRGLIRPAGRVGTPPTPRAR